ncbi:MAG: Trk system potassium transporter TrkA [Muribaculaceae bacterium]|nr:Trk system potassium transporter TrkA [Muribaculaceae bacterium]
MKIVIAGAGEVGTHLAKLLSNEDQDIILIDSDQDSLDHIDSNYNLMTYNGSTSSFEALKEVRVDEADLYIAVTPFETRNITSCGIAKRLGAKKTVARIDNYEFLKEENKVILKQMGVDNMIYPEFLASQEIRTSLEHTWARHWGELHNGQLLLIGVKLRGESALVNKYLKDLPRDNRFFHIAAIKRNHETIIPGGNDIILENDIVYFITDKVHLDSVRELCGKKNHHIRKVMIMGGSRIAIRFSLLNSDRFQIKIIDPDMDLCEELAYRLPNCEIVHGDARDIDLLRDNRISQYDAFIALSDSSETNILSCLTAKEFGVKKTVAEVENLQFLSQAENLNIGTAINKKLLASSRIFKLLLDADENNSKTLALADAEVAELVVKQGAKVTKSKVKDLKLPSGMTLAAVVHNNECSLVSGDTLIEAGDSVVVFCLRGSIHKVEKLFS